MGPIKRLASALALTLGLAGAALACPTVAGATPPPDCKTVTSHLVNRPDHGHGTPDVWALDTVTRTVQVCVQPPAALQTEKVAIDTWSYTAKLTDTGTFVTQAGTHGSPNNGASLAGGVHGAVLGAATFAKFTAPHDWIAWDPSALDGKTFNGSEPTSTGDWLKLLWKDGFGGSSINMYSWVYQTCVDKIVKSGWVEQWIDGSFNNDGQDAKAGDIRGRVCPTRSPSPSPSPSTSQTSTAGAVTTGGTPSLPVTGAPVPLIALGGLVLIGAGIGGLALARRRRDRVQFES